MAVHPSDNSLRGELGCIVRREQEGEGMNLRNIFQEHKLLHGGDWWSHSSLCLQAICGDHHVRILHATRILFSELSAAQNKEQWSHLC